MKYLNYGLLIFALIAVLAEVFHWSPVIIFFAAALGVVPLAGFMGKATEELTVYTGPKLGGLLNATLGNAAELIISIVAIQKGLIALVLASITGSILGNLLLILGFSVFLGGLKFGIQSFDRRQAAVNSTMLILSIIALFGASLIAALIALDGESNWPEGVQLLGVYVIIGLAFSFYPERTADGGLPTAEISLTAVCGQGLVVI